MYKSVLASVWVCMLAKKRLERGWRKTPNVGKSMAQCSVKRRLSLSLFLSPSLFFKCLPLGFLRETKEFYLPLSPACFLLYPPSSLVFSLPSSSLFSLATFLSFSILLLFYSPSLLCLPGCFAL